MAPPVGLGGDVFPWQCGTPLVGWKGRESIGPVAGGILMARNSFAQFIRSRLAVVALPLIMAALASLAACDKNNDQPDRRYCDQSGCFACNGDRCYPVPGDPAKPDPG